MKSREAKTASTEADPTLPAIAVIGTRGIPASYGGFETCVEETAVRWAEIGHPVTVYCWSSHAGERIEEHRGVELRYVSCFDRWGLGTPTAALCAITHLTLFRRSVAHVHLYNNVNALMLPMLMATRKRVLLSVDGIEWKRSKWGRLQRWTHKLGERCAIKFDATVVTDNEAVADYYRSTHGIDPTVIAYGANPLESDPKTAERVLGSHDLVAGRYFLFVGRLVPEKGVGDLIDAYERLETDLPLVIVGDGDPGPYRDELMQRSTEKIRFLGYQYGEAYTELLTNASMYLSASEVEGTSPSLLAAMGAGICSLVNGIAENIATTAGSIALYEEGNVDDLVAHWQKLIDDPARADDIAADGRRHVEENYQWDTIARRYLEAWDFGRSDNRRAWMS